MNSVVFGALYTFVTCYALLASVEFGGAGMLLAGRVVDREGRLLAVVLRYMSPTWEVTNSFLVLLTVGFGLSFPSALPVMAPAFLVPLSIALFFQVVRISTFIALYLGESARPLVAAFAMSSAVCPVALAAFFAIWAGANSFGDVVTSPVMLAFVPLSLFTCVAAAGGVLGNVVDRDDEAEVALGRRLRRLAAVAALLLPAVGLLLRWAVGRAEPGHLDSLDRLWWVFLASGLIMLAGAWLSWTAADAERGRLGAALLALQFVIAFQVFGITEGATLGPGRPSLQYALAGGAARDYLVVCAGIAAVVLIPSLALMILVLRPWAPRPTGGPAD